MDYTQSHRATWDAGKALKLFAKRLTLLIASMIPTSLQHRVNTHVERLKAESEGQRRLPRSEHDRIAREILAEEKSARTLAAGVARYHLERHIAPLNAQLHAYIAARKRDVSLSFEHALDHFRPADMVNLALLREARRAALAHATPAALLQAYQEAFERRDAVGLVDAELIEARVARGGLASSEEDLPAIRELTDTIEGVQDLRVEPAAELRELAEIIEDARKAINRADVAQVLPRNPDQDLAAKQAHEGTEAEFKAALAAEANAAAAAGAGR